MAPQRWEGWGGGKGKERGYRGRMEGKEEAGGEKGRGDRRRMEGKEEVGGGSTGVTMGKRGVEEGRDEACEGRGGGKWREWTR